MCTRWLIAIGALAAGLGALALGDPPEEDARDAERTDASEGLDPAAWGGDHVGQPVPEYMTGDECLFCHRQEVGASWPDNRHQTTVRQVGREFPVIQALLQSKTAGSFADDVEFVLGHDRMIRYLRNSDAYGKLDMLSVACRVDESGACRVARTDNPHWDGETFVTQCAGCHATAVDPQLDAFAAVSLDCYVCHGDVPRQHANDSSLVHLSEKRGDDPRVVASICGQCHIRRGKSRSTGRPYPNNFVPGDNLFRDFVVDFSAGHIQSLNSIDRHVLENIRDIAVFGRTDVTCLDCHEIHDASTILHQGLEETTFCNNCHYPDQPKSRTRPLEVHSSVCGY